MKEIKLQKGLRGAFLVLFFWGLIFIIRAYFAVPGSFTCNSAGALGFPWPLALLWGVPLALLGILFYWWSVSSNRLEEVSAILLFSGGSANLFERFWYHCIADYWIVPLGPAFNLADTLIFFGVIFLTFSFFPKS